MEQPKSGALRAAMPLEILDRAFRIYRENFRVVILLVGLSTVFVTIFNLVYTLYVLPSFLNLQTSTRYVPRSGPSAASAQIAAVNSLFNGIGGVLIATLVILLAQAFLIAAPLTYLASERFLGRTVSIGQAYRAVAGRWWRLGIGLIVFYALCAALVLIMAYTAALCGAGVGVLIFVLISLYPFLMPVFVLERTGVMQGLSRAWFLAKTRFWPLLWISLAVLLITGLVQGGLFTVELLVIGNTLTAASRTSVQVVQTLLQAGIGIFIAPILPITFTMMYYDARIRVEGLDIALQCLDTPDPRPADLASPPPGQFMNSQDWRNVGLLALLGVIPFIMIIVTVGLL
ncbi:MAG TPA: hypothetical protein VKQ72_11385, partial [Aggregatilineales bacterium]|nr:hypothetical protein [Aggregatilineales bacterium]